MIIEDQLLEAINLYHHRSMYAVTLDALYMLQLGDAAISYLLRVKESAGGI